MFLSDKKIFDLANQKNENARSTYFIAIDMETGGFNDFDHEDDNDIPKDSYGAKHYAILQIAVIIYNGLYEQIGEHLNIIIHHSKEELEKRNSEWSKKEFGNTLMLQCPESNITLARAEKMIIEHLNSNGINKGDKIHMLGNSIRLDFDFMASQMKSLKSHFNYRLLDVSSLHLFFTNLYGANLSTYKKEKAHDALNDIHESMAELRFYIDMFTLSFFDMVKLKSKLYIQHLFKKD